MLAVILISPLQGELIVDGSVPKGVALRALPWAIEFHAFSVRH